MMQDTRKKEASRAICGGCGLGGRDSKGRTKPTIATIVLRAIRSKDKQITRMLTRNF